jgi:AraC-like DNA-binding protein
LIWILFIAILSLIISLVILKYAFAEDINYANLYLSGFFLVMGLYGTSHYIINYSNNPTLIACVLNIFTPLFITIGPFLYLYTKKTLTDNVFQITLKEFLFFFIPFIIIFVDLSPHLMSSFNEKIQIATYLVQNIQKYNGTKHLLFTDSNSTIFRLFINLIFILFSVVNLFKIKIKKPLFQRQSKVVINFLYFTNLSNLMFIIFMLLFLSFFLKIDFLKNFDVLSNTMFYASWASHGVILITVFFYPSILYNIPLKSTYIESIGNNDLEKKKYKNYELESDYINIIKIKLDNFLNSKKIGEDFNLSTISFETKIPTHHLKLFFKEELKISFTSWKHKYKIQYALKLINEGSLNNLTIEAIAIKSGFQSYSNFYNVFKDELGVTPSEYIKNKE